MALFKLLASKHYQADPNWKPSEEEIAEAKEKGTKPRPPSVEYVAGQLVPSNKDLVKLHGNEKFRLVDGSSNMDPKKRGAAPPEEDDDSDVKPVIQPNSPQTLTPEHDDQGTRPLESTEYDEELPPRELPNLERMNVADLKAFAHEEEIDLGSATTKNEIIARIKHSFQA